MIYNIRCTDCKRFLGTTESSVTVTIKCSNSKCKKSNQYKVVFISDHINAKHKDK